MREPCSGDVRIWCRRRDDTQRRFEVGELLDATRPTILRPAGTLDVWHAAELYLRQHRTDAELEVAQQVSKLRAAGDREGVEVWVCIYDTISRLRREFWSEALHAAG